MALGQAFLDELRARVALSSLLGSTVKLIRAGREFKACCPFHSEKTPSFTVNDEKGFYHCFGCGAHGDAIRWLQDMQGLEFIDAVRELAGRAGLDMPERDAASGEREARLSTVREALEAAQAVYAQQLGEAGAVMEYLAGRGIGPEEIAAFGIGFARGGAGSLKGRGIGEKLGIEAGLLTWREAIGPGSERVLGEAFWDRVTVPIHDHRGRLIGFGARVWPQRRSQEPKFVNSPETPLFDKGGTLFNLHRASPCARPAAENRLVIVEGYFDVIALARAGVRAAVAPNGTALTERQLTRAWRVHHRPVVLFDGDAAGRKASLRACETALPMLAPGRELAVACLPDGQDPDDLLRGLAPEAALGEIEALLLEAVPLHRFVFDAVMAAAGDSPEGVAGVWERLAELAHGIADEETRAQYLGTWRALFERECSAVPAVVAAEALHAIRRDDSGEYVFPESEADSAKAFVSIVRRLLHLREERRTITADVADVLRFAKGIGFDTKQVNAVLREIESDLAHGPGKREEEEMLRVLYRRTLGIKGPMTEAMLPQVVDARPRQITAQVKRQRAIGALIDAGGLDIA